MALLSPLLPRHTDSLHLVALAAANAADAAPPPGAVFKLPPAIARCRLLPLGVESAVRYRGDDLIFLIGRTTTRERSCDLVAFATLATLAAAAATRTISYHRAPSELSVHRLCQFRRHSPPSVFSRRAAGVPLPTHRLVIVLLPPPWRRRSAGHAKTIISGHVEQVPAVSRIEFGYVVVASITSSRCIYHA